MVECLKCHFENYDGTVYCQKCGNYLKKSKVHLNHGFFGAIAKLSNSGNTMAPLVGLQVDANAKNTTKTHHKAPIIPLEDGSWYCPDCGEHNKKAQYICRGCGRQN